MPEVVKWLVHSAECRIRPGSLGMPCECTKVGGGADGATDLTCKSVTFIAGAGRVCILNAFSLEQVHCKSSVVLLYSSAPGAAWLMVGLGYIGLL